MSQRSDLLFLCVANSARSQMAEGWARQLAPPGVGVHSAGSEPGSLNPFALRAMAEVGIDLSSHFSKPISAVPLERVCKIITLCGEEVCPVVPLDVERLHWPLHDPASAEGDDEAVLAAFRRVRDEIHKRIEQLFANG